MVMVPFETFFRQDALEVRTSSTTPGDEKNQFDPLALIFIHILTYIEEELAWRHWERLLRATSTWAIFTALLYNKVLIKTSQCCVPPMTQGPLFHQRLLRAQRDRLLHFETQSETGIFRVNFDTGSETQSF